MRSIEILEIIGLGASDIKSSLHGASNLNSRSFGLQAEAVLEVANK